MIEVYKRTDDDWFPSFGTPGSRLVEITYLHEEGGDSYIVHAAGDDDYYIGKRFDNEAEAWTVFLGIIRREVVSIEHLRGLGFLYDY